MAKNQVARSVVIDAPAERIFGIIAAPHRHPDFDGSGSVHGLIEGPERLGPGDRFGMRMRIGLPYRMSNRVVEFEENRVLAWRHFGRHRWRWELQPLADGATRVTETFDYSYAVPFLYRLAGWPARNARAIEETLVRLKALAEDR
ncbi:SRPBCC family protein [Allosalinactinospora lopnorensis]|uniref:SRPBCC family protein n=1 Tax=Allosalinactinospora lopnorensis TaxID=1352348 RepID=UPI000623D69D|nr:SRPBCC family protein [Allosalinactinospora lopnorensis]